MKKLLSILFVISSLVVSAQVPQGINYQSIIRNIGGVVLPNTSVNVEFRLYSTLSPTTLLYGETHTTTTNSFGMVNLIIGQGTVNGGVVTFNNIPWVAGIQYEVWVNSSMIGTRQSFMSVPYALHAQTASAAPAPGVTYTNNILSVGGNTVSIATGNTYTAGIGVDLTGNIITNTAPNQTVSISGSGVSGTYPNFTISQTPSVSVVGPNVSGVFPNYTISSVPAQSLAINGNTLDISSGNSVILPSGVTYTAGNGIDLTGNIIVNTAPDQTVALSGTGATSVTGAYPNFTINTPTVAPDQTVTLSGTGATSVTGVYPNFTINTPTVAPDQTVTLSGTGATSVTGVYPNFTINSPTVAPVVTPTITSNGIAIVTPTTGNVFNVDVAAPSLSYTPGNNVLTLTQGSAITTATLNGTGSSTVGIVGAGLATVNPTTGSNFTVSVPSPTFTANGPTTITGIYPSLTINSVASPSTTLVQGSNVILNQSVNTYTVAAVTPTLNVIGGALSGSYPTQTLTIPASSLTTLTAGSNVVVTGSAPNYTVSSPSQSLTVNTNSLSITGGNTVIIPTSSVVAGTNITVAPSGNTYSVSAITPTITGTAGILVTGTYPTLQVNSTQGLSVTSNSIISLTPAGGSINLTPAVLSYTPGTNVLKLTDGLSSNTFTLNSNTTTTVNAGTNITVSGPVANYTVSAATQTLSLVGSTLSSGVSTNSVNLASVPGLWAASSTTAVVLTNTLNNVGIGTVPASQFKLDVAATGSSSVTIHGFNSGSTDSFAGVFGENSNSGIGVYGQSNGGKGIFGKSSLGTGTGVYGESDFGSGAKFLTTNTITAANAAQVLTNGTGAALFVRSFHANRFAGDFIGNVNINGRARIDSVLSMEAYPNGQPPQKANASEGRIYFDGGLNKFMVSENSGAYKPLFGASPWVQGAGTTTLTNINDKVGIGTSIPNSALEVAVTNSVTDGIQVNVSNTSNGGNALQVKHFGVGNAGHFEISNANSNSKGIEILNNGQSHSLYAINSGSTNASAGYFQNTNPLNGGAAIFATANNMGTAITAINNGTSTVGSAASFELSNPNSTSSAVDINSAGSVAALRAINTNTASGSAGDFEISGISNASPALYAKTSGQGPVITIEQAGPGRGIDARIFGSSSTSPVIFAQSGALGSAGFFEIFNPSNNSNAITAVSYGTGATIFGNNAGTAGAAGFFNIPGGSSNTSAALVANNIASGNALNAASGNGNAVYATSSGSVNATIYANNSGLFDGIQAYAANSRALFAQSSSNGTAAVEVNNTGTGTSLTAYKSSGTNFGSAATFGNGSSTNSSDAVVVTNAGPASAINASSSSSAPALKVSSSNATPYAAQFVGDAVIQGKTSTDSVKIAGPVAPQVGAVLVSRDASGDAKWSNPVMFKSTFAPSTTVTINATTISGIGNTSGYSSAASFNVGGGLAITAGNMVFTAPVTGFYDLNASLLVTVSPSATGNAGVFLELYNSTTATTIERAYSNNSDNTTLLFTTLHANTIVQLTAGQQVVLRVGGTIASAGTITPNNSPNLMNQFSGNLIR